MGHTPHRPRIRGLHRSDLRRRDCVPVRPSLSTWSARRPLPGASPSRPIGLSGVRSTHRPRFRVQLRSMSELRSRGPFSVIGRILWLLFGAYIVVTSLVGAIVGVQAFNGWLAILYGALGVTMGLGAILSGFVSSPRRALLIGWSLVGLASRAVLEGNLYLWIVSLPI